MKPSSSRLAPLALLLVTLLSFALRLYRLDGQQLSGDEAFSLVFSAQGLSQIISASRVSEPHPPLYFPLLHYWMVVAGKSEFSLRYLSLLFSVPAVPLIYALGRALFNSKAGLLAAFILAINPFHLFYAQETRMYSLVASLSLASAFLFWMALKEGGRGRWLGYIVVSSLSIYAHYSAVLILMAENLFMVVFWRAYRHRLKDCLASQGVIALLYLPWLLLLTLGLFSGYGGTGETIDFLDLVRRCILTFSLGWAVERSTAAPYIVGFGLLFLLGLGYAARKGGKALVFLLLYLGLPTLVFFVASQGRPLWWLFSSL